MPRVTRALVALTFCATSAGCAALSGFSEFEKTDDASIADTATVTDSAIDDLGKDLGIDTTVTDSGREDSLVDSADETGTTDSGVDSSIEVGGDTSLVDTSVDTSIDSGVDSGIDTGVTDSGTDSGVTLDSGGCGGTAGPTMVSVGTFCIDSTEVTKVQYKAFVDAKGTDTSGQPAVCSWNTSWTPPSGWGWPYSAGEENYPIGSVDWCDAYAYCKWAGKRLCGNPSGGTTPFASYAVPASSQWYYACSGNGATIYPYGNTYQPTYCQGGDIKPNKQVPVATKTLCVGGFPGIFDMSGNAYEIEDSCDGTLGAADKCRIRGGDELSFSTTLKCSADVTMSRNQMYLDVGFRCCSP